MLLNCGDGEDSCESLGLPGYPSSLSWRKSVLNIHWKDWCGSWNWNYFRYLIWRTDSLEKTLVLGKIEGKRERGGRGWDGWMASPTQWTWVCASSGSWWWTGKPGVLFGVTNSQIQLSDWTELNSIHIATVEHTSRNHRKTFKPLCPQQCILSLSQELTSILSLILISLLLFWQFHLKNILFHVFKKLSY